jgi:LmbE family N-acetylglucosaminyl deacetylase
MTHTLVTFHAHPDDEAIATGGTMARAKAEGHRVVLVVATRGELGEYPPDALAPGETITERRVAEQEAAAKILGVDRVAFLGYRDSGMAGESTNDDPECFWQADVEQAAGRLADILRDERATVLTVYDDHGGYGHPDHIQVHRVGIRAAELAGTARVYESTMNRDFIRGLIEMAGDEFEGEDAPDAAEMDGFVSPAEVITTTVDVLDYTGLKRDAMAAHASQIPETSFFQRLPIEMFREAFRYEWFIRRDDRNATETTLFDGL